MRLSEREWRSILEGLDVLTMDIGRTGEPETEERMQEWRCISEKIRASRKPGAKA